MPLEDDLQSLLAQYQAAELECPEPRPYAGWNVSIGVPEDAWLANTRIDMEIRPGILNTPGGGLCAQLSALATAPDGQVSTAATFSEPSACVPIPEPPFWAMLTVALVTLVVIAKRKKAPRPVKVGGLD